MEQMGQSYEKQAKSGKLVSCTVTSGVKVLFIQANEYASGLYRIGHIAEALEKLNGEIVVDYFNRGDSADNFLFRIGGSDVIVFQLQTDAMIAEIIPVCKEAGIPVVMDMDDDLLNVPEWNPSYFDLGRKFSNAFISNDGRKMNVKNNIEKLKTIRQILRDVSLITVTGKGLRNAYSRYNKVKILPNSVDPKKIKPSKRSGMFSKKVRIFWQGSQTHLADLGNIKGVVQRVTEQFPEVQWMIWGSMYKNFATFMGIPEDRVETKETVPFADYYKQLRKIKMDIGICPLIQHSYNECKSNIKWLEYSLCGIPTVATDIITYEAIRHEETGFLAKNNEEWFYYLAELIKSPRLRKKMARAAKEQVLQDFNIHSNIKMWEATLLKLHNDNSKKI
ncbi:MAG TPA: glycosyltransferase [Candidatus Moranbacteria bacterium]|nr:glycosyltransferase [Candidatus Pacearchaeota archaeon]HDZ85481.1 glycosyltransferase [Candidatus Moranbacteria bacterium]